MANTQTASRVVPRVLTFKMVGASRILFGKPINPGLRRDDETHEQFDQRMWRLRAPTFQNGTLGISAVGVHRSFEFAGSWLNMKLSGKSTYTKRLKCGMCVTAELFPLTRNGKPLTCDDLEETPLYVPSDGKRGGSRRVWRSFPAVELPWQAEVEITVFDEALTEAVLLKHAQAAGMYDGIGSMRIGTGGQNGQWLVEELEVVQSTL